MNREASLALPMASTVWQRLNSRWHEVALWGYMVVVFGHWLEHIVQAYQVFMLGWARADAGGVLGLWFPGLATSEVLHMVYNTGLLAGLVLLRPGFVGRGRMLWNMALILQIWHFFEHVLLQVQWITGIYFFGAAQQTSLLEPWFPRVELHFIYNTAVFLPMAVALYCHFYPTAADRARAICGCARGSATP